MSFLKDALADAPETFTTMGGVVLFMWLFSIPATWEGAAMAFATGFAGFIARAAYREWRKPQTN